MKKILSFALALILLLSLLSLTSCFPSEFMQPSLVDKDADSSSVESTAPETKAEEKSFAVGDTVSISNWNITVNSFEFVDKIPNGEHFAFNPDEGNKYAVANITVKNVGEKANTFLQSYISSDNIKLEYSEKYTYSSSNLLAHDDDLHDEHLNPLTTITGIIAFEVPNEVVQSDESLMLIIKCDGTTMKVKLR